MKAIRIEAPGGADKLRLDDVTLAPPGPGEIRVRHAACGINFIDIYQRTGLYPIPMPSGLGMEGAGTVESIGEGVTGFRAGERVGYVTSVPGSYAQAANVPAARAVKLPLEISETLAAAIMLKGMTAEFLLRRTYAIRPGDTILFHAAAGGVGQIACQWAKTLGATVIGTVGSDAKAEIARAAGCDHVIVSGREDIAARVMEITGGNGVPVVYDSVGKDTWEASLAVLQVRGLMVSFGNASGPVDPVSPRVLMPKALYLTRPGLYPYTRTQAEVAASAAALFDVVMSGAVRVGAPKTYALADAAQAHRDLEGRRTTGSLVLIP
jgi:NADPH2:quinone reductase